MKLHSNIFGSGQPLVILHGFLGTGDNWKTLGKRFADVGFEVHLVDQRNHGRSPHDDQFNFEVMVADLGTYFETYSLSNSIVLGHSMGGKTAMFYAGSHPERVSELIVADISPRYYPQHHQRILAGLSALDFETLQSRKQADEILASFIPEFGVRQFLLKNLYWKEPGRLDLRFNLDALKAQVEHIGQALPNDYLFKGASLFLRGGQSDYIGETDGQLIQQHFPNSSLVTIDRAGHWLHAEKPEEFYSAVMHFIS